MVEGYTTEELFPSAQKGYTTEELFPKQGFSTEELFPNAQEIVAPPVEIGAGMAPENTEVDKHAVVAQAMQVMSAPERALTAAGMKAAEHMGIPGAKEWNQKFNPEYRALPEAFPSDVSDFYIDKLAKDNGVDQMPGAVGDMVRDSVKIGKTLVGLGANIGLDPLMMIKSVGGLTKEAEAVQKMGGTLLNPEEAAAGKVARINPEGLNTVGQERNLISVGVPFTDIEASVRGDGIQRWFQQSLAGKAARAAGEVVKTVSPDTGIHDLDVAGRSWDARSLGDPKAVIERTMPEQTARNMSDPEKRLASALVESTPNVRHPDIPEDIIQASRVQYLPDKEVRPMMEQIVEAKAKEMKVDLAPGRKDAVVDAAMQAKRLGAENLADKVLAGAVDAENIAQKVIPNHLPHVPVDIQRDPKQYASRPISSKDPTYRRKIEGTLEDAIARKATPENPTPYITDPVAATTARLIQSKKLLRDAEYLETVKNYGVRMRPGEAKQLGYAKINHPELNGKTLVIKEGGETKVVKLQDLYFPKDIAEKVQSRVYREPLTGALGTLQKYDKTFRKMIFFASPGIKFGNSMDNMLKGVAVMGKDTIQATQDAISVARGTSTGFRSMPTAANPEGIFYDGKTLQSLLTRWVPKHTAFAEGMEDFLNYGKDLAAKGQLGTKEKAVQLLKDGYQFASDFGSQGEHLSRQALFLQRLRSGWSPEMASSEVTKWMFNYNRNSPKMEVLRTILPFIQHPMKTMLIAPELLGKAPALYNLIQNSGPHLFANAFHDPITQVAVDTVLPESMRHRDGIVGPFIPANTTMASIFGIPGAKAGSAFWFDPRIGMRIMNHFDYFNKGGSQRFIGATSPALQGVLGLALGKDLAAPEFMQNLDYANGNTNFANRVNFLIGKTVGGIVPFPNMEKMLMQSLGVQDPKFIEPYTVMIMRGMGGQFGGVTDLDHDIMAKLTATYHAYQDQKKQFMSAAGKEAGSRSNADMIKWASQVGKESKAISSIDYYQQMMQSAKETQQVRSSQAYLLDGARETAARMKFFADEMHRLNQTYQILGTHYLNSKLKSGE